MWLRKEIKAIWRERAARVLARGNEPQSAPAAAAANQFSTLIYCFAAARNVA
jgi:hypothetical protein